MLRALTRSAQRHYAVRRYAVDLSKEQHKMIDESIKSNAVVLFMKGTPQMPQCGFSGGMVQILNAMDVKFQHHDVLASEELRTEIKEYSDWPTIPQLYVKGEFIGGFDIVKDMMVDGTLEETLKTAQ